MSTEVERVKSQYDEVPYTSHPFPQSAPENIAAIAHLFGLDAPPVATARVLELGCSSGGNLIPLAVRHPRLQALGLDLSGVQVTQGQRRIEALGLSNLRLQEADLGTIDSDVLGEFDYIVCHGVYSWVPPHVQEAILRICKRNLAADGVAYVSYNLYPGWKAKEIVRDAMMLRGNPRESPTERLSFARGMIEFLQQVAPADSVLAKVLQDSAPLLRGSQDYYLLHEYLEAYNAPCYFQDFLQRAEGQGLGYLAEAEPPGMFVGNYPATISEPLLKECGHSQVLLEQYLDFAVNRAFRQTLLVHAPRAADIRYQLQRERLQSLHFAAALACVRGQTQLDDSPQEYGEAGRATVSTAHPAVKLAIEALRRAWPQTVAHAELLAAVRERLPGTQPQAQWQTAVDDLLEHLIVRGLVRYRLTPVVIGRGGARPCVEAQVRRLAELSRDSGEAAVFNAWHETVALAPVAAWLLPLLDGSRDRAALFEALLALVEEGKLILLRDGQPLQTREQILEAAPEHLEATLRHLAQVKLIGAELQ